MPLTSVIGRGRDELMGSEAKQGIAALVPSRSLTLTTIMGSEDWWTTGFCGFFSFLSLSFSSRGPSRSSRRRRSLSRWRSPSRYLSPNRSASRSLRGDRRRSPRSRYPRSSLRSSPAVRESSSRRLSFHRKPPVFLGRLRWLSSRRRGDLLRDRSGMMKGGREMKRGWWTKQQFRRI